MFFLDFRFHFVFLLINGINCSEDNDIAILSQMQDWGGKMFRIIEDKPKANGQYLVAVVLSDKTRSNVTELPKTILQGCPTEPNKEEKIIECSTSAVILNKINKETWRQSEWKNEVKHKNHSWHGEYRLVNTGIIERLIKNFHNAYGNMGNCQIYLYSYFIPCADIPGCPYSCSDQVAKYNNRGDIKCKISVLGYTTVFRRSNTMKTNAIRANEVLRVGMELKQIKKEVKVVAIGEVRTSKTFQELMYSYLFNSPLSGCCVDVTETKRNSPLVISFFVNAMVYEAVNHTDFENRLWSKSTRADLANHFENWLRNKIHTDCSKCSDAQFQRLLISFCANTALDLADGFGQPTDNDLGTPKWEKGGRIWKRLYKISPAMFLRTKSIMCAERSLSVYSLCTKLELPPTHMKRNMETYFNFPEAKIFRQN